MAVTEIEIDEGEGKKIAAYYDPDYRSRCEVCGQVPTVRIRKKDRTVYHHTGMCGACTWGEAEALDPNNW